MKEQYNNPEAAFIKAEVAKINFCLPYPKSLEIGPQMAVFDMASGIVDESAGGSVHDIDYYTFPASALNRLILDSVRDKKTGKTVVEGHRYTDYVDWPYGREDGSEIHRNNEPVTLRLAFKQRGDMNVFIISESDDEFPPQIGGNGFLALLILKNAKEKSTYRYVNMVYSFLRDPVIPDFGRLSDLDTPCELVFDNYFTPETSSDGDYSEERKRILYFDKAMVIEALAKLKSNATITVKGNGRAVYFLERAGYGYNHNENTVEINEDVPVEVAFSITYAPQSGEVVFGFKSEPIHPGDFSLSATIRLSENGVLASKMP